MEKSTVSGKLLEAIRCFLKGGESIVGSGDGRRPVGGAVPPGPVSSDPAYDL